VPLEGVDAKLNQPSERPAEQRATAIITRVLNIPD
jgi:hypothetical protein